MKIIVGLGNPGFRYRNTRHNVGFKVLDSLAKKHNINVKKKGFQGLYGIGRCEGSEIMLFKPQTYMNLSGIAVKSICSVHLKDKSDMLVLSDEFNLSLGKLRLKDKGSAGGHNGLRSIIDHIGPDFHRLRLGVGNDALPEDKASYVLAPFSRKERGLLEEMIDISVECVEMWLKKDIAEVMSRYNGQ